MDENKLEQRAEQLKQQFDSINLQIDKTIEQANEKITSLNNQAKAVKEEAQNNVNSLIAQREQLRGAYTELIYIIHPELQHTEGAEEDVQTQESVDNFVQPEEQVNEEKDNVSKSSLSTEEIKKVKAVTEKERNDVPDYLKEDYNK